MTAMSTPPEPSGPVIGGGETLRRTVSVMQASADGKPTSSAFIRSTHDGMMSTLREAVSGEEAAARWIGTSPVVGVWPVEITLLEELVLQSYADGGKPCACVGGCPDSYPEDHASVDLRLTGRSARERYARKMKERALELGPIYPSS